MPLFEAIRNVLVTAGERYISSFSAQQQDLPSPPIHRLPVEILGEIFFCYLDVHKRKTNKRHSCLSVSSECTANPFIFGHICHHWRIVALSTPTLWASLAIYRPKPYMVPMVKTWLERAAECPLSLYILVLFEHTATEAATANALVSLFVRRFRQWKHIELHLPEPSSSLLSLPPGGAPRLQSASLHIGDKDYASVDKVWRSISSSPELSRVSWDVWYMERNVASHIPWTQLTHVRMDMGRHCSLSPDAFLAILRSCQELEELDFDAKIPCTTTLNTPPFILPKLHTLKMRGVDCNPTPYINCLILPSLTSIDVLQHSTSSNPGIFYLDDLFTRSACQLGKFHLCDFGLDERDTVSLLSSPRLQSVHDLRVWVTAVNPAIIELLTRGLINGRPILPHLKKLYLSRCDAPDGALSALFTARLPILKAFNGSAKHGNSHPKDLAFMQSLRNAGLDFDFDVEI